PGNNVMYHLRRGFVLANLPGGVAQTQTEYELAAKVDPGSPDGRGDFLPPLILLFLGEKHQAGQLYREMTETTKIDLWQPVSWKKQVEYLAGKCSAEELLRACGTSQWFLCDAHFLIGLSLLAEGNRSAARQHFQQCVDTQVLFYWEYQWGRVFLAWMEEDPQW